MMRFFSISVFIESRLYFETRRIEKLIDKISIISDDDMIQLDKAESDSGRTKDGNDKTKSDNDRVKNDREKKDGREQINDGLDIKKLVLHVFELNDVDKEINELNLSDDIK